MITRKELLSSKEYWLVKFQSALYEQVEKYLIENKISKTEFAKKLGVSKGYVSQILNGDFDHKISKLIELSLAIEKVPLLKFENVEKIIFLDSIGVVDVSDSKDILDHIKEETKTEVFKRSFPKKTIVRKVPKKINSAQ